jgi:hypothetical protein
MGGAARAIGCQCIYRGCQALEGRWLAQCAAEGGPLDCGQRHIRVRHLKSFTERVLQKVDSPLIRQPPKQLSTGATVAEQASGNLEPLSGDSAYSYNLADLLGRSPQAYRLDG